MLLNPYFWGAFALALAAAFGGGVHTGEKFSDAAHAKQAIAAEKAKADQLVAYVKERNRREEVARNARNTVEAGNRSLRAELDRVRQSAARREAEFRSRDAESICFDEHYRITQLESSIARGADLVVRGQEALGRCAADLAGMQR